LSAGAGTQLRAARGRTRRSFIGAAAATGVTGALAGPLAGSLFGARPDRRCAPTPPGIPTDAIAAAPDGRLIWTTDARATTISAHRARDLARRRSIDVGGAPTGIAISPDGQVALVTTAFYDHPGLAVVDLHTGSVDRLDTGPEPHAVAFAPDGRGAWVAGGGRDGTLVRVEPLPGRVHAPLALGAHPRGLAILPDGKHALVALRGDAAVALVSLGRSGRVRPIRTAPFPHELAVSPDGKRAVVTHSGFGDRTVSIVDLDERRVVRRLVVGPDPGGVAYSRTGAHTLVACTGGGFVAVLDDRGRRRRRVAVGGAPRSITVAGTSGIVADKLSGSLVRIRVGALA
jgi:DNA-binding beta-propeller fold protein YncE